MKDREIAFVQSVEVAGRTGHSMPGLYPGGLAHTAKLADRFGANANGRGA